MAKNLVQDGHTIEFVASGDVKSGEAIAIGAIIAVSHSDVADGEVGVGHVSGVWLLPKSGAQTINPGTAVFLADGSISTDDTGTYAGVVWEDGDQYVHVNINFGDSRAVIAATTGE